MIAARGVLVVGAAGLLLSACVAPPYGYYPPVVPAPYAPYGPAPGYGSVPLPPPVPPGGVPGPQGLPGPQPYDAAPPRYRDYDPAPPYRSDEERFRARPDYDGVPVGPGYGGPPAGSPDGWDAGRGRDQPQYRSEDGLSYGQPRRNRLDDPEPDSGLDGGRNDPPYAPSQPRGGSSGLGEPTWR